MGVLPGADAAASSGVHGRRVFGYDLKETGLAFAFLAPSLVIFGVFFLSLIHISEPTRPY